MNEAQYQNKLIKKIERLLPGCHTFKNDPRARQGIPDILIVYRDRWAMLEVKISEDAPFQPNQEHYIDHFNELSFCAVIFPENEEEILNALQHSLGASREARVS